MFYLRLNRLSVIDNGRRDQFLGLVANDIANVKLISFVTTDHMALPDVDAWREGTKTQKRTIEEQAIEDAVNRRIMTSVRGIKDGHKLSFGDTGYVLHKAEFLPAQLDWACVLLRSKRDLRKVGTSVEEIIGDPSFEDFYQQLISLVRGTVGTLNQRYVAASQASRFVASVIAKNLEDDEELLGLSYLSLSRSNHFPDGLRSDPQVQDLTGNVHFDYTIFGFDPGSTAAGPSTDTVGGGIVDVSGTNGNIDGTTDSKDDNGASSGTNVSTGPEEAETLPQPRNLVRLPFRLAKTRIYSLEGSDAFFFTQGMTVDADGSPRCYHPKNKPGLDHPANGGRPGNWWGVVTDNGKRNGKPIIQGPDDPAPGFYVSTTSLIDGTKNRKDPARYVNSEEVPYFVLPPKPKHGAVKGDLGMIINLKNQKCIGGVYADVGPVAHLGEGSIAAARALGINDSPRFGGTSKGIVYVVFPGTRSRPAWPWTPKELQAKTKELFKAWGGMAQVNALYPTKEFVRSLQIALNDAGASLVEDGDFGPKTESALRKFQIRNNLDSTGWVDGPTSTLLKLQAETKKADKPATGPLRTRLINRLVSLAQGEVGVTESGGPNRGRDIVKYQAATWLEPDSWPWCAAFTCWLFREAMRELDITSFKVPTTPRAFEFEKWGRENGHEIIKKDSIPAKKGDIIVFDFSHVGIVVSNQSSSRVAIKTVEGNTNAAGSREGDGVWKKSRKNSLRRCLVRLRKDI